jgi:hypothetical protein
MRSAALFLLIATTALQAQDIGAFRDYRDHFFVFDRGTFTELEALRRTSKPAPRIDSLSPPAR